MPTGSITDQDASFVETWENIAPSQNAIIRLDKRGEEKFEIISGRRSFMITSEERIITQDRVRDPKNDPFLNGSFRPVIVPDSINVESNPNALSDEEIMKIFSASDLAWGEWLNTLDSVATLRRMLELADASEGLTLKRYRELEQRLVVVRPRQQLVINDPQLQSFLSDKPSGREAGDPAAPKVQRRQGGRSSDYRVS